MDWNVNTGYKTLKGNFFTLPLIVYASSLILFLSVTEMESKSLAVVEATTTILPEVQPIAIGPGASEKDPSTKLRKKALTSVYLKYFETAPDGKTRKCKFCGQSYSIATATGTSKPFFFPD